jgi:formylglycine-generating enzyme
MPRITSLAFVGTLVASGAFGLGCDSSLPPNGTLKCAAQAPLCPSGYLCKLGTCWQDGTGPKDAAPPSDTLPGVDTSPDLPTDALVPPDTTQSRLDGTVDQAPDVMADTSGGNSETQHPADVPVPDVPLGDTPVPDAPVPDVPLAETPVADVRVADGVSDGLTDGMTDSDGVSPRDGTFEARDSGTDTVDAPAVPDCTTNNGGCSTNATCTPITGGRTCTCKSGFSGDGVTCSPTCGDGTLAGNQACDDGNTNSGDGCSSTCTIETGWRCVGAPSRCTRSCTTLSETECSGGDCCATSTVPGGTFLVGQPADHTATVSTFSLDRYEVTVGRFRSFVQNYQIPAAGTGANPHIPGSGWQDAFSPGLPADAATMSSVLGQPCDNRFAFPTWTPAASTQESLPLNCVNWYEAFAFCIWDGGRLPTETEWEYAAAGGVLERPYPWGVALNGIVNDNQAVYGCHAGDSLFCDSNLTDIAPVGTASQGGGAFGQLDLAGSVQEWTLDWFAPYPTTCTNCANLSVATSRSVRGGGWSDDVTTITTYLRNSHSPSNRADIIGFRCARDP